MLQRKSCPDLTLADTNNWQRNEQNAKKGAKATQGENSLAYMQLCSCTLAKWIKLRNKLARKHSGLKAPINTACCAPILYDCHERRIRSIPEQALRTHRPRSWNRPPNAYLRPDEVPPDEKTRTLSSDADCTPFCDRGPNACRWAIAPPSSHTVTSSSGFGSCWSISALCCCCCCPDHY